MSSSSWGFLLLCDAWLKTELMERYSPFSTARRQRCGGDLVFCRTSFSEKQGQHVKTQSMELLGAAGKHLQVLRVHVEE